MATLKISLIISVILMLTAWAAAYVKLADIDYLMVIHFDSYRGIDFLGDRGDVFGILTVGLVINLVNFLLAWGFYRREHFLAQLISYATIFISLLILIAVGVIISIN